jgi:bifunctional N-acetylglucosamine-1-phosphate-uridyltransferase/glucosamine-1-phosphate-acetyltransferase GlmU-like protein
MSGEFYLTDIIRIGYDMGRNVGVATADPQEILASTPDDLARVEAILKEQQKSNA